MRIRRFSRRRIIKRFGQWGVTRRGIENVTGPCSYQIDKESLVAVWWGEHMPEKNWVIATDFRATLTFARRHFGIKIGGDVLW